MINGYSRFGLHKLRPSPDSWTLEKLIKAKAQQKPEVLDPFLILRQNEYVYGKCTDIIGQIVSPTLVAKREQNLVIERERKYAAM